MTMELDPYVTELAESLNAAAAAGDDSTRRTATLLAAALAPSARLALMSALSDFASEVTQALDGQTVELRLEGRDVRVVVSGGTDWSATAETEAVPEPAAAMTTTDLLGEISRITLRLPELLKNQAESTAANQGVSLNNWLTLAVQTALTQNPQHRGGRRSPGSRISGWVTG
jgi:hypothetical protein